MKLLWLIALATLCRGQSTDPPPEIVTAADHFLLDEKQSQYLPPLETTNNNYIEYQNQYQNQYATNPQLPIEMQNVYDPVQTYQYLPTYQEQYGGQPVQENIDRQYVSPVYVEPEQYTTHSPIVINQMYDQGDMSQSTRRFDIQPQPMFNQNQTYYSYMYKHPDYQENNTYQDQTPNSHSYYQPNQQNYEPQPYTQREYRPIQRQNNQNQQNQQNQQYQQQDYQNPQFNQTSYSYMYQPAVEYTTMKPIYGNNYIQDKTYSPPFKMDWGSKPSYNASKWNQKDYVDDFPNQVLDAMKSNQAQPKINYNNPVYGERIIPPPPLYAMSRSSSVPVVNIPSTNEKVEKTAESILQPTKYIPQVPSQFKPTLTFDAGTHQYAQQYTRPYQPQGPSTTTEPIPILKQMAEMEADGSFHYETLTGDQTHIVQQGHIENLGTDNEEQVMQGSYSFVGDDGRVYTVNYIADANGFRATGDHLPTAPPMPEAIQRSIEANLAQEAAEAAARLSQPYNQYDNQLYTNQINDLSRPSQPYAQYSNNQLTYAAPEPQQQQQQQPVPLQQPQPQAKERSSFVRY